jgi:hypothetical protein
MSVRIRAAHSTAAPWACALSVTAVSWPAEDRHLTCKDIPREAELTNNRPCEPGRLPERYSRVYHESTERSVSEDDGRRVLESFREH